jgi:hypothetical protein
MVLMKRFRQDNTYGYGDADIDRLNKMFDSIAGDETDEQILKHLAEKVQREYDDMDSIDRRIIQRLSELDDAYRKTLTEHEERISQLEKYVGATAGYQV